MTARQSVRARRRRHEQAAAWVVRNADAGRSGADDRTFQDWLDRDPENRAAYEAAQRLMGEARAAILTEPALRDFKVKPRRSPPKKLAIALVTAALAGSAFVLLDGPMRLQADVMSGAGEMPVLTLADGSRVQLNAGSAFAAHFTAGARTVVLLRGQGFFQVAKDLNRPFVVEARGVVATALGTAFDVRIAEATTDVTVTEHVVLAKSRAANDAGTRLGEGQQALYDRDGRIRDIRKADTDAVLAWRRGQLVVDDVALAEVVMEIGRHFSGRIVIADAGLAGRRVSGTFAVTDTAAALALLRESLGLTVTRIGPLVLLRD